MWQIYSWLPTHLIDVVWQYGNLSGRDFIFSDSRLKKFPYKTQFINTHVGTLLLFNIRLNTGQYLIGHLFRLRC